MREHELHPGPDPINVRQGWHRKHRLLQGWFQSTVYETATECFAPLDLDGARMLALDLRVRVRRPVANGAYGDIYAGIFQARFSPVVNARAAGGENMIAEVSGSGVKTARIARTSDVQPDQETATFRFDRAVDLRPDLPWLLYVKLEGDLRWIVDPHNFGSRPEPYTGTYPSRATLIRRMASTTIYAPSFELRSAYGRFMFGDPATEK